ncbi:MAG: NINE protein [Microcoleaceae cyanobacterium]
MRDTGLAYLLWCTCFFGVCGAHRFYNGKYISGLIWLFTGGFVGIGQLIDLMLIPGMVERKNLQYKLEQQQLSQNQLTQELILERKQTAALPAVPESDTYKILRLAKDHPEGVSVADCVIATEKPIPEVRNLLQKLYDDWLLNRDTPNLTGSVIYYLV